MLEASRVQYRIATALDAADILVVLEEVASQIPLRLDGQKRRDLIINLIRECCDSGTSWIATQSGEQIIGFLLSKQDEHEISALHLSYGGVSKSYRGQKIFSCLIQKAMTKAIPLIAFVHRNNQSDMIERLKKFGFIMDSRNGFSDIQIKLRWQP